MNTHKWFLEDVNFNDLNVIPVGTYVMHVPVYVYVLHYKLVSPLPDLVRFNGDPALVLFLQDLGHVVLDHLGHVVDVTTTLGGGDRVDEGHLLEPVVGHRHRDLVHIVVGSDCNY